MDDSGPDTTIQSKGKFLTDSEYYEHIRKKTKKLQKSTEKEKEVILRVPNGSKSAHSNDANLVTKQPKITDINADTYQTETIPSLVKPGKPSRIQSINPQPEAASSVPSSLQDYPHLIQNKVEPVRNKEADEKVDLRKENSLPLSKTAQPDEKDIFPIVYEAVPNWGDGFQPYLVTTSSPTTKALICVALY